jgi:hypothetical protein
MHTTKVEIKWIWRTQHNEFHSIAFTWRSKPSQLPKLFLYYASVTRWNWLRWSRGSVLAFGTQFRGFKPGRSRRIFNGGKILSTPSFGGEVKLPVPCRRFATCKRSLELRGSRILDEICRNISRPRRVPPSVVRGGLASDVKAPSGEGGNV